MAMEQFANFSDEVTEGQRSVRVEEDRLKLVTIIGPTYLRLMFQTDKDAE